MSIELTADLQALHVRALAGDRAPRTEWFEALQPTLRQSYANANANAKKTRKQQAIKRLADGIVECLARVPAQ